MAQNATPRSAKGISTLSGKMGTGIGDVGASVPVTVIPKAENAGKSRRC